MLCLTRSLASLLFVGAVAAQATEFVASLDGAQETPPNNSPAKGKVSLQLDASNYLTWKLVHDGLSTQITGGHIHRAAVGVAGPIVIPFTGPSTPGNPTVWTGTTNPTKALNATEIADLRAGLWYVNIHTSQYSGGEIRGQIYAAAMPTTFGSGCLGSNSKTPAISGRSFPVASNSVFRINLTNGKETSLALLLVGLSKTNWLGIPLPANLAVIGMPGCTAYCDDTGFAGPGTYIDAVGAAFIPLLIPYNHSIVGATLYSQWLVIDSAANLFGATTSNALEYKIQ